jgi:hypothetical protein
LKPWDPLQLPHPLAFFPHPLIDTGMTRLDPGFAQGEVGKVS